jgi:hypothetical protein
MVLVYTLFVFLTPSFKSEQGGFSYSFYIVYFLVNLVNSVVSYFFYVAVGAFQARIVDKSLGGVYFATEAQNNYNVLTCFSIIFRHI